MSLRIFTGLPATGKTSTMIGEMGRRREAGDEVVLFLSSEHEELTRRPNVKPGGLMGCRVPGLNFKIDHVVDTAIAVQILSKLGSGALAVFDEAQYFRPEIVNAWADAARSRIDVMVGMPSTAQLDALDQVEHELIHMEVDCSCGTRKATQVVYEENLVYPVHLCDECYEKRMNSDVDKLLIDVRAANPFPGELHTYQPFYDVEMQGWELVRADSPQRLEIILNSVARCAKVKSVLEEPVSQPTFIDLGCCSGFFSDGMTNAGFRSSGVDVDEDFIDWGNRLAMIKGQSINYTRSDLLEFLEATEEAYDVISTFATVQWVMAQKGYEAGMSCFRKMFEQVSGVCIVEMGYTTEDIYKDKIDDRPGEIDRDWVLTMMSDLGDFAAIEVHPAGENGIWRDVFVGFKEVPTPEPFRETIHADAVVQISNTTGYWQDGWVATAFEVYLQAQEDLKQVTIEGWRPEGSGNCNICLSILGSESARTEAAAGLFAIEATLDITQGQLFRLSIETSIGVDTPGDDRDLAFVLRSIDFN